MPHNIDSMAYYGDVPWHKLGTRLPERVNADEMLVAAGLDWEVQVRGPEEPFLTAKESILGMKSSGFQDLKNWKKRSCSVL